MENEIKWEMIVEGAQEQVKSDLLKKKVKFDKLVKKKNDITSYINRIQSDLDAHEKKLLKLKVKLVRSKASKKSELRKVAAAVKKISYEISDAVEVEEKQLAEKNNILRNQEKKLNKVMKKFRLMKSSSIEELKMLKDNKKLLKILSSREATTAAPTVSTSNPDNEPLHSLVELLSSFISSKESSLECPVCYSVSAPPIFRCPNSHIICKTCLPRVGSKCPTCRTRLGPRQTHRQAEDSWQELNMLKSGLKKIGL